MMKKLNGVNTIDGVYSGEFQLSDLPNFGEWKITATVSDQVCSNRVRARARAHIK